MLKVCNNENNKCLKKFNKILFARIHKIFYHQAETSKIINKLTIAITQKRKICNK